MNTKNAFDRVSLNPQVVMLDYGFQPGSGVESTTVAEPANGLPRAMAWCPESGLVLMEISGGHQVAIALPKIQRVGGEVFVKSPSGDITREFLISLKSALV